MFGAIVWWVVVGLVAGWATGKIMKGGGYGPVLDIVLGIAGAIVGGFLLGLLGFSGGGGIVPSILVATFGACVVVWLAR